MREELRKAIADSLYVHFPLKPEADRSIERVNEEKKVLRRVSVWDGKDMSRWTFDGEGEARAEDGMLRCLAFSLIETAGDLAGSIHLFFVLNTQGEEIYALSGLL